MKDNLQHIEEMYRDALNQQELTPSVSFKRRMSMLLLFIQIKKYLVGFLVLFGVIVIGYSGYSVLYTNNIHDVVIESKSKSDNIAVFKKKPHVAVPKQEEKILIEKVVIGDAFITKKEMYQNNEKAINYNIFQVDELNSGFNHDGLFVTILNSKRASTISNELVPGNILISNFLNINIDSIINNDNEVADLNVDTNKSSILNNRFSISLYASPCITLSKVSGDNNDDYENLRNENESSALSWTAGGDIQIHFKKWFIQTGINYSVYRNNKNYNYSYQLIDSANSYYNYDTIWVWIYDPPNLEYPVMVGIDTTWVPVYDDISVIDNGTNEWSYLEIPILLGYNIKYKKFGFELATGISFGFLMNYSGAIPRYSDMKGIENLDKFDEVINNTMYNYNLQLGVTYSISNNWELLSQLYYKQNLKSIFKDNYPIDQRFRAIGLNIGLRYGF